MRGLKSSKPKKDTFYEKSQRVDFSYPTFCFNLLFFYFYLFFRPLSSCPSFSLSVFVPLIFSFFYISNLWSFTDEVGTFCTFTKHNWHSPDVWHRTIFYFFILKIVCYFGWAVGSKSCAQLLYPFNHSLISWNEREIRCSLNVSCNDSRSKKHSHASYVRKESFAYRGKCFTPIILKINK